MNLKIKTVSQQSGEVNIYYPQDVTLRYSSYIENSATIGIYILGVTRESRGPLVFERHFDSEAPALEWMEVMHAALTNPNCSQICIHHSNYRIDSTKLMNEMG